MNNIKDIISEKAYTWYDSKTYECFGDNEEDMKMLYLLIRGVFSENLQDIDQGLTIFNNIIKAKLNTDNGEYTESLPNASNYLVWENLYNNVSKNIYRDLKNIINEAHIIQSKNRLDIRIAVFINGNFIFDSSNIKNGDVPESYMHITQKTLDECLKDRDKLISTISVYWNSYGFIPSNATITIIKYGYGFIEKIYQSTVNGLHSFAPSISFRFDFNKDIKLNIKTELEIKEVDGIMNGVISLKEE